MPQRLCRKSITHTSTFTPHRDASKCTTQRTIRAQESSSIFRHDSGTSFTLELILNLEAWTSSFDSDSNLSWVFVTVRIGLLRLPIVVARAWKWSMKRLHGGAIRASDYTGWTANPSSWMSMWPGLWLFYGGNIRRWFVEMKALRSAFTTNA